MGKGKGEGLGERLAVSILGLDDDRFRLLYADEGLLLDQSGDVVVHVQQPHRHDTLRRLLRVLCTEKSALTSNYK